MEVRNCPDCSERLDLKIEARGPTLPNLESQDPDQGLFAGMPGPEDTPFHEQRLQNNLILRIDMER